MYTFLELLTSAFCFLVSCSARKRVNRSVMEDPQHCVLHAAHLPQASRQQRYVDGFVTLQ